MDPLATIITALSQPTVQSASAIHNKIRAAKETKNQDQIINTLCELINELIEARENYHGIAISLKERLVAEQITEDDVKYIINTVFPAVKGLLEMQKGEQAANELLDSLQNLLSVEMLTVLQILGFNYKTAVGEPLTVLLRDYILSFRDQNAREIELKMKHEENLELWMRICEDPEARERITEMQPLFRQLFHPQ